MNDRLAHIPHRPGVYLLKDERGRVIYVGKARDLRERLKTHFIEAPHQHARLAALRRKLRDFDFIGTTSEIEALILEANLIKLHLPRYNVRLKDDKKYPYIKVTLNEDYPRVFSTRNLKRHGSVFFGPYTNVKSMTKALRVVKKIFPIRSCHHRLPSRRLTKPCLNYYIKKCCAPCQEYISKREYRELVNEVCRFLCGKSKAVEEELDKRMRAASDALRFEEAARLRDQLRAVREVVRKQRVIFDDQMDRDAIGLVRGSRESCTVILQIRDGKLVGQEHYILSAQKNIEDEEIISTFLKQYYKNAYFVPDELILSEKVDDAKLISNWLTRVKGKRVQLRVPQRGERLKILEMVKRNAVYLFQEYTSKRDHERVPFSLRELQAALSLEELPRIIEAFDISDLSGSEPSGSLVLFKDGKPKKSEYRRFKIRSVQGIDDYAMMRELVYRRYRRVIEQGMALPNLVLIDGGIGHLSTAKKVMEKLELSHIPVLGMAKRLDEIVLPDGRIIMLPKSSYALRVLQHLRDEAHRFAVTYHRTRRRKKIRRSLLDDVPGIGEEKRRELLRYFGSIERMRRATLEEITEVRGVSRVLGSRIYAYLHPG